jgi:hypothetical protein
LLAVQIKDQLTIKRGKERGREGEKEATFLFAMHQRRLPSFRTNYSVCYITKQQKKELHFKKIDKKRAILYLFITSVMLTDRSEFF